MSQAFVIEVNACAAGIVVRDGDGFRFHAACEAFSGLDGRNFRSPSDAHKAASRWAAAPAADRRARLQVA
jgi:hypothetical protein